ncbi:RNA-dependent RNA polymerase [Shuangao Bedbug Virus 2]|uniref:RNA-dependent RNA polymerase n=1 Tax=Shuangao Bedbug Virus 2 TaxID=1608072 RepID=UPI0005AD44DF|nr:RNA-dependent RNA polymerase [Shuangao Bedbug Virus 2]AJG39134.1 RNA-dependent RNA polymerase [Shuangao Bedbug Virus 2]
MPEQCADTHLNSPLGIWIIKKALTLIHDPHAASSLRKNRRYKDAARELQAMEEFLKKNLSLASNDIYLHFHSILHDFYDTNWQGSSEYLEILRALLKTIPAESTIFSGQYHDSEFTQNILTHLIEDDEINLVLTSYMGYRAFLEAGVCLTAKPSSVDRTPDLEHWKEWKCISPTLNIFQSKRFFRSYSWVLGPNFAILLSDHQPPCLVTREHFLMISDLISQRFICLFSCYAAKLLKDPNYPSPETLSIVFAAGDRILSVYGNKGYKTLKTWEPLCIAHILCKNPDPIVDNSQFLDNMETDFYNSQTKSDVTLLKRFYMTTLKPLLMTSTLEIITQLFGLYRIWGHPTVDGLSGIKMLKRIVCRKRVLNYYIIRKLRCKWRERFALNYFKQNKRWPGFVLVDGPESNYLIKTLKLSMEINLGDPHYNVMDWQFIRFSQTFNIPDKFEFSEMISDKATSHNISELIKSIHLYGSIGKSSDRSVICQWLKTNFNDPVQFLRDISENGFGLEEVIVGVHPKERELKIDPRLFGLLTIKKRLYVVITEALLAQHILPYFPEITMTFNAETLMIRIFANTKNLGRINETSPNKLTQSVVFEIDFNKWNSYMREEETYGLFEDFDDLFGIPNCFVRTHSMFKDAQLYLADGSYLPTPHPTIPKRLVEDEGTWSNHLGGIEGLRQKGWTIFTVVVLRMVCEEMGISVNIMGQGDNQVMILTLTGQSVQDIQEQCDRFKNKLHNFLQFIGPPLKFEETWISSQFFIYGKYPVYLGVPLPMSLKRLCRTMRLTNEFFINLESTLSSISANASAATSSCHDPFIPFLISKFESFGAIMLHLKHPFHGRPFYKIHSKTTFRIPIEKTSRKIYLNISKEDSDLVNELSPDLVNIMLLQPSILGGYPSIQAVELTMHGFPDPLSLHIYGIRTIIHKISDNWYKQKLINILHPQLLSSINPILICQDPVALNLVHSSSASEKIKRMVHDFLTHELVIRNEMFRTFLKTADEQQDDLAHLLFQMEPFHPKIANSILGSTIFGRAERVVAKVNKTGTIISLMLNSHHKQLEEDEGPKRSMVSTYHLYEKNYFLSVIFHLTTNSPLDSISNDFCSTQHAAALRQRSWGKEIHGITVAVPQELLLASPISSSCLSHPNKIGGYISILSDLTPMDKHNNLPLKIGPFRPFFKTTTKSKVGYEGRKLRSIAPPLMSQAIDLLSLINWACANNSNLANLIKTIFQSFTDLPADLYTPDPDLISGCYSHRWNNARIPMGVGISILYLHASHVSMDTRFFHPELCHPQITTDNLNINFQSMFSWILFEWTQHYINSNQINLEFHYHVSCKLCIKDIYQEYMDIPPLPTELMNKINRMKSNPYCWVPQQNLLKSLSANEFNFIPTKSCFSMLIRSKQPDFVYACLLSQFFLHEAPSHSLVKEFVGLIAESEKLIPFNLVKRLDLITFLEAITAHRILFYIYHRITFYEGSKYRFSRLNSELLSAFINTPSIWFKSMISVLFNVSEVQRLCSRYPSVRFPSAQPPSEQDKARYLKYITVAITKDLMQRDLSEALSNYCPLLYVGKRIELHPVIISLILAALRPPPYKHNELAIKILAMFKRAITKLPPYTPITNSIAITQLLNEHETSYCRKIRHLKLKWIPLVTGNLEPLTQLLTPRNPLQKPVCPAVHLNNCNNLGQMLIFHQINTINKQFRLKPISLKLPPPSLCNHFYKTVNLNTTAHYKLISILGSLQDIHPNLFSQEPQTILCAGDGAGGFSVLMSHIFPTSTIIYNSYFDKTRLSSVGANFHIPSAILMNVNCYFKCINIHNLNEQPSDLLSFRTLQYYLNEFPHATIITCDAEGSGWTSPQKGITLLMNLLEYAKIAKSNTLIFKTYAANLSLLYVQISMVLTNYRRCIVYRSSFSTVNNSELYLIGIELHLKVSSFKVYVKDDIIYYNGFTVIESDFEKFTAQTALFSFNVKCHENIEDVNKILRQIIKIQAIEAENDIIYKTMTLTPSMIHYPCHIINHLRKQFPLVKFTPSAQSRFRPSLLRLSLVKIIVMEILSWGGHQLTSPELVQEFEDQLKDGLVTFSETMDGFWSVYFNLNSKVKCLNSKTVALRDLFQTKDLKELLITMGQRKNYKWEKMGLSLVPLKSYLSHPRSDWWRQDTYSIHHYPFSSHRGKRVNNMLCMDPATERLIPYRYLTARSNYISKNSPSLCLDEPHSNSTNQT